MSVAFTKESDSESVAANLPDRPVSVYPNYVTASGLAALDAALAAARAATVAARAQGDITTDRTAMARATRDLRYWSSRRASAHLVEPAGLGTVTFGAHVTIEHDDGSRAVWHITGEDEADPAHGSISYAAPLARALVGKSVGDAAKSGGRAFEIVEIG